MIINLIYDSSANNAPASFKAAMQQAAAILDAAITNPITVAIKVGYGVWARTRRRYHYRRVSRRWPQ